MENFNGELKHKLDETTENLNNAKNKLNLQNNLRQKDYKDYEVKLADLKAEIHTTLKETNAEKDTMIEGLKSELEKTKQDVGNLENQLKTCKNTLKELAEINKGQLILKCPFGAFKSS